MIIFAGPIGSGKSEQGQRLAKRLGCAWVSSGQLLRDQADQKQTKVMEKGSLVGDDYILSLLEAKFNELDAAHKEFILDGTPRTLAQAQWLIKKINDKELKFTAIILLRVSKAVIIKRLDGRGRNDDKLKVIDERLKEYSQNTVAAIKYLKMEGLRLDEVDGEKTPEEVEKQIASLLNLG